MMTGDKFNSFADNVIKKFIDELQSYAAANSCKALKARPSRIKNIYLNYEKKRREIRHYFMHLEDKPMDRHKIAAVMIYSVLKSKIFKVNKLRATLPDQILMANEYLALYTALSIVESYRIDDGSSRPSLVIPPTYHGTEDGEKPLYINNTCKALCYMSSDIKHFDVFAYANVLFLLERYTDDCVLSE